MFVFEDDFPLNGEQDGGGGSGRAVAQRAGSGQFNLLLMDAMGGNGDFTGQMTYDMFNQPLTNSLAGTIDPLAGSMRARYRHRLRVTRRNRDHGHDRDLSEV